MSCELSTSLCRSRPAARTTKRCRGSQYPHRSRSSTCSPNHSEALVRKVAALASYSEHCCRASCRDSTIMEVYHLSAVAEVLCKSSLGAWLVIVADRSIFSPKLSCLCKSSWSASAFVSALIFSVAISLARRLGLENDGNSRREEQGQEGIRLLSATGRRGVLCREIPSVHSPWPVLAWRS